MIKIWPTREMMYKWDSVQFLWSFFLNKWQYFQGATGYKGFTHTTIDEYPFAFVVRHSYGGVILDISATSCTEARPSITTWMCGAHLFVKNKAVHVPLCPEPLYMDHIALHLLNINKRQTKIMEIVISLISLLVFLLFLAASVLETRLKHSWVWKREMK